MLLELYTTYLITQGVSIIRAYWVSQRRLFDLTFQIEKFSPGNVHVTAVALFLCIYTFKPPYRVLIPHVRNNVLR